LIDTEGLAKLLEALNERCECEGGTVHVFADPCPPDDPPVRWWISTIDGKFIHRESAR
jgi:hypothetical protein